MTPHGENFYYIPGCERRYTVSKGGIVVSMACRHGPRKYPLRLKPMRNQKGYLRVELTKTKGDKAVTMVVHKIVAMTFLGPIPEGKQVNHKNGIKTDNRVENLEYVTPKENVIHAYKMGLKARYHKSKYYMEGKNETQRIRTKRKHI